VGKSIKVSKELDSSLVSIENLSEILMSGSWAQDRYQQLKKSKTYLTYDIIHKKLKTQNFIFHCRLEDLPQVF